jgi:hypothetical protein
MVTDDCAHTEADLALYSEWHYEVNDTSVTRSALRNVCRAESRATLPLPMKGRRRVPTSQTKLSHAGNFVAATQEAVGEWPPPRKRFLALTDRL